jgi:hypothetical protein
MLLSGAVKSFFGLVGRGVYRVLVGKHEGRRPMERHRRRWDNNIRVYLQEVVYGVWTG